MTALSVTSPFLESDWDRRLDTMLQDLETGSSSQGVVQQQQQFQQSSYSFSSTQQTSSTVQSAQQQQQRSLFSSQQVHSAGQILPQQHAQTRSWGGGASTLRTCTN